MTPPMKLTRLAELVSQYAVPISMGTRTVVSLTDLRTKVAEANDPELMKAFEAFRSTFERVQAQRGMISIDQFHARSASDMLMVIETMKALAERWAQGGDYP